MSNKSKSISPIPIGDPAMVPPSPEPTHSSVVPTKLSSLRRSWSAQHLPSFPVTDHTSGRASNLTAKNIDLPELPSLGAMASKAVFAMEGYEELLAQGDPSDLSHPKINISELPTDNSIFEQQKPQPRQPSRKSSVVHQRRANTSSTPSIPHIPKFVLSAPSVSDAHPSGRTSRAKTTNLSAMPVMEAPKVSIPLVRDQFSEPADLFDSRPQVTPTVQTTSTAPTPHPVAATGIRTTETKPNQPVATPHREANEPQATPHSSRPGVTTDDVAETPSAKSAPPQYTDRDLRAALHPIIAPCVDKFLYSPTQGIHTYLEPMLRSTVRRAIAEQMEDSSPFREVSGWDKLAWKMRAAFSSQTYEDIVFDVTKRYQVEEVFLLRPHTRSLISYASHDPSRHAKPSKVQETVKKIASKTNKPNDNTKDSDSCIKWENTRNLMIRRGDHCILAAIVHGPSNAILRADLDYALRQAEERFGKTLQDENDIHLQILQPLLEGCLLIQASAIPN